MRKPFHLEHLLDDVIEGTEPVPPVRARRPSRNATSSGAHPRMGPATAAIFARRSRAASVTAPPPMIVPRDATVVPLSGMIEVEERR